MTELIDRTLQIATAALGPENLSDLHRDRLRYIAEQLSTIATTRQGPIHGKRPRKGLSLPVGGGKTLLIKSFIRASHELGLDISVAVAASEVNALCSVRDSLISEHGIPEEKIGMLHTMNGAAPCAATPEADLSAKQFLLCTHNMVRTEDRNLKRWNRYGQHPRDILIYDESLIISDPWSVRLRETAGAAGWMERAGDHPRLSAWVGACAKVVGIKEDKVVELPKLEDFRLEETQALAAAPAQLRKDIQQLILAEGKPVRVIPRANRAAARFSLRISDLAPPIAVLDASHTIRLITQLGSNVEEDTAIIQTPFTYPEVKFWMFKWPTGRHSIEKECKRTPDQRSLLQIMVRWIEHLPKDEAVLIWTFKQQDRRSVDVPGELARGLKHHGVDMGRVLIQTHGSARGSNAFEHIPNCGFYGVFYPREDNVAAQILGQKGDLAAPIPELDEAHYREVLHEIYQEAGRTALRKVRNGVGGRAAIFLPVMQYFDQIRDALPGGLLFPEAQVEHVSRYDKAEPEPRSLIYARAIIAVLRDLPPHWTKPVAAQHVLRDARQRIDFDPTHRIRSDAMRLLDSDDDEPSAVADELRDAGWEKLPSPARSFQRIQEQPRRGVA